MLLDGDPQPPFVVARRSPLPLSVSESTFSFKMNCLFVIFFVGVIGGLAPTSPRVSRLLPFGNALSAGVFLSAGLCHLLPHAVDGLAAHAHENDGRDDGRQSQKGGHAGHGHSVNMAYPCLLLGVIVTFAAESLLAGDHHGHDHGSYELVDVDEERGHQQHQHHHQQQQEQSQNLVVAEALDGQRQGNIVTQLVVAALLGFHGLVEGIALGAGEDLAATWTVFIAIISHKLFAAFALGVNLATNRNLSLAARRRTALAFSATTPLGILIGAFLTSLAPSAGVSNALQAFAAGTFVYVGLCEVLVPEFKKDRKNPAKWACLVIGAIAMTGIVL